MLFEIRNSHGYSPFTIEELKIGDYEPVPLNAIWHPDTIRFMEGEYCLRIQSKFEQKNSENCYYLIDIEDFTLYTLRNHIINTDIKEAILFQVLLIVESIQLYATDKSFRRTLIFIKNGKLMIGICMTIKNIQDYGSEIIYVREIIYSELKQICEKNLTKLIIEQFNNPIERKKLICEFGVTDLVRDFVKSFNKDLKKEVQKSQKFVSTLKMNKSKK